MDDSIDAPTHPQVDPPMLGEYGGHVIYPMPAFVRLASPDPLRIADFFTRVLDSGVMFRGPEVDRVPLLIHLRRMKYQDVLVVRGTAAAPPGSAIVPTFAAGDADGVDSLAERVRSHAPDAFEEPVDTPWNTRDFTVTDPDGNRYTFTAQGRQPEGGTIDEVMQRAVDSGGWNRGTEPPAGADAP
jgi:uncharacterized glyoxalase superfamily protein PhnB